MLQAQKSYFIYTYKAEKWKLFYFASPLYCNNIHPFEWIKTSKKNLLTLCIFFKHMQIHVNTSRALTLPPFTLYLSSQLIIFSLSSLKSVKFTNANGHKVLNKWHLRKNSSRDSFFIV